MGMTFAEPGSSATFDQKFWTGTAGTVTSDSSITFSGNPRSTKVEVVGATGQAYVQKQAVVADAGTRISFRWRVPSLPGGGPESVISLLTSGFARCFDLAVTTGGVLQLRDAARTQIGTNGSTLSAATKYRISLSYVITDATHYEIRVFVNGNLDISVTNGTSVTVATNRLYFGYLEGLAGDTKAINMGDFYVDDSSGLNDTGDIMTTAKRPFANGTTNGFDLQIGAGGSGYGSGHAPQVNERPLDTANGWSKVGVGAAVTEEYSIESAGLGDVDVSGYTIIGIEGWLYASSLASETGKIRLIGVDTNISLTSANTMFLKVAATTSYPAGGSDIGIITATDLTTVSLYETGIVIAYTIPPPPPPQPLFQVSRVM